MATAARHADTARQTLTDIHGRVLQTVNATSSGYTSDAATLFRNVMTQWHQDFNKILSGIDRIQEALTSNQKGYQATMEQEQASANQVAAMLNGDSA